MPFNILRLYCLLTQNGLAFLCLRPYLGDEDRREGERWGWGGVCGFGWRREEGRGRGGGGAGMCVWEGEGGREGGWRGGGGGSSFLVCSV